MSPAVTFSAVARRSRIAVVTTWIASPCIAASRHPRTGRLARRFELGELALRRRQPHFQQLGARRGHHVPHGDLAGSLFRGAERGANGNLLDVPAGEIEAPGEIAERDVTGLRGGAGQTAPPDRFACALVGPLEVDDE